MDKRRGFIWILVGCLAWCAGVRGESTEEANNRGGLTFESHRFEKMIAPTEDTVVAVFRFKNETGREVTIEDVHTNCGCIRADSDKKTYADGESGKVEAEFKVGSFKGVVEKTVTVQTNIAARRLQTLTVVMDIPTLIEIKPDLTEWLIGTEPEPKEVTVRMKYEKPVRVVNVTSSRANVDHEVVTVKEGELYKILLTPKSTEKLMLGVLRIETDCEIEKYRKQMAFFGVVKARRNKS